MAISSYKKFPLLRSLLGATDSSALDLVFVVDVVMLLSISLCISSGRLLFLYLYIKINELVAYFNVTDKLFVKIRSRIIPNV